MHPRHPQRSLKAASPTWQSSASTSSTCRPSTPSASPSARARTTTLLAEPGDVGSPWAIGSELGGHKSVNPDLGTLEDFRTLRPESPRAGYGGRP